MKINYGVLILIDTLEPALPDNKQQWPELVGKTGKEAVQIIKKETGNYELDYIHIYI